MIRILAAAARPGGDVVLGGWAAAFVHGARDLDGVLPDGRLEPVVLCSPTVRARRHGQIALRSSLDDEDVVRTGQVTVTSPVRTAFDLGRTRPLMEAVVALDALLRQTTVTKAEIVAYAERRRGWRGVPRLRAALELADSAARSCQESRLRVVWVADAGLPRPLVNPLLRASDGRVLGMPDLLDKDYGLVGEYDGGTHRDLLAHTMDNRREEDFEEEGLIVVRATALDLLPRGKAGLIRRLRAGHARARRFRGPRGWCLAVSNR